MEGEVNIGMPSEDAVRKYHENWEAARQKLKLELTVDEYATYRETGTWMIETVCSDPVLVNVQEGERIKRFFIYFSDYMYHIGGCIIASTFKALCPEADQEAIRLSYVAGWCFELLSASWVTSDNITDNNSMRGLRPTWHVTEGVEAAVRDVCIAERTVLIVMEKFFGDKPYFPELLYNFHHCIQSFYFGQIVDGYAVSESYELNERRYFGFARIQFGLCGYGFPFKLALVMAGEKSPEAWKFVHDISLLLGELARAQNDYRDFAIDSKRGEKMSMDIPNGKANWMYLTAVKKANDEQKQLIQENFGKDDVKCVSTVGQVYNELDVIGEYLRYEESMVKKIREESQRSAGMIPRNTIEQLLGSILRKELY